MAPESGPLSPDEAIGAVLVDLVLASRALHPDGLPAAAVQAASRLGGRQVVVLLVDLAQVVLTPLGDGDGIGPQDVDGSSAGAAFRTESPVVVPVDGGWRLWLPLMDSAERIGVLGVVLDRHDAATERRWQALASLLGEMVVAKTPYGDSINRARRTAVPSLAAELRWAMLPPLAFASPTVSVWALLEPAYEIAGDTFDYAVNGTTLHLAILDAMGHGLEASRMANLAVTSYRHSRRAGLDLTATVVEMDRVVRDQFGPSKFVTGQVATLDTETGLLRMLNLGHPLPLLLRDRQVDGRVECLPGSPVGLGWAPGVIVEVQLEPGDLVLFHTDGISEARAAGGTEEFGDDRFEALVGALLAAGERPAEILRRIVQEILAWQERRPRDDATLLLAGWRVVDPHVGDDAPGVPPLTAGTPGRWTTTN